MQRLKLDDFKLKNLKDEKETKANHLLGQVLGDCHDISGCDWCGVGLSCDERSANGGDGIIQ
ncbi:MULTISPECIES: hypothetical protein [unclassified Aureispira]|uniref:hypothetical protein n=1 Tax=unclassified Aureispira TaxID=2649989 RepID=UPI00069742E8|nr:MULTISPECIES: hypothetical protein [unclassified Aureispira]WMX14214.1 hypothetical protein QP953_25485 [Aureispira sp. CCB-E]